MSANSLPYSGPALRIFQVIEQVLGRLKRYYALIKSLQTGLLLVTSTAGYVSGCCLNLSAGSLFEMLGSLFLAVSGSTVLNMVFDRDIDSCMGRTVRRPLPSGEVSAAEGWALGLLLTVSGLVWAAAIDLRYAGVVLVGVLLDVGIYTMLLKRRTPYAVLIGGLSGGMPALAGRVLAVGEVDGIGLLLALGVLLWIPTHIMTFNIKYQADYARARVPTFPSVYGIPATRQVIAVSTLLTVSTFFAVGRLMSLPAGLLASLGGLGLLLILLVVWGAIWPGPRLTFVLYKGASIYMLASMLVLIAGGW